MMTKKKNDNNKLICVEEGYSGKLWLNEDRIIKVQNETVDTVTGYDILTEEFITIPKKGLIAVSNSIIKLLGNERAQLVIATHQTTKRKILATIFKVSERTIFRKLDRHDMSADTDTEA